MINPEMTERGKREEESEAQTSEDKSSEFLGEPTTPREAKGFPIRRTIAGGLGAVALTAAGFLGFNKIRSGNDGSEKPGAIITDSTLEPATQPPTLTPEPTSTPEPVREYPEFMPDAKRIDYGTTSIATSKDFESRKDCPNPNSPMGRVECPPVSQFMLRDENYEINGETISTRELLDRGNESMMALAWMRLNKNLSISDIFGLDGPTNPEEAMQMMGKPQGNYEKLLDEYREEVRNGGDTSFTVYGFTEEGDYNTQTAFQVDASWKIDWDFEPDRTKYTYIKDNTANSFGFVGNKDSKILSIVIYSFSGGGINNTDVAQGVPEEYLASFLMSKAGAALSDKKAQINQSAENRVDLLPVAYKISEAFVPFKTSTLWKGIVIAR